MVSSRAKGDRPLPRCYERRGVGGFGICGELARFARHDATGQLRGFYCEAHRHAIDVPIARDYVVQEVAIEGCVLLAGASSSPAESRAEALARLETALEAIGGQLHLYRVRDNLAFTGLPAAPGAKKRGSTPPEG